MNDSNDFLNSDLSNNASIEDYNIYMIYESL